MFDGNHPSQVWHRLPAGARTGWEPVPHRALALISLLLLMTVGGCEQGDTSKPTDEANKVSHTASADAISMTITATPERFELSQQATVRIEVLSDRAVTVQVDDYRKALLKGDLPFELRVVETNEQAAVPTADNKLRWTYDYQLEFFLPGNIELPPARITYVRSQPGREGNASDIASISETEELTTEPLTLAVREPENAALTPNELREVPTLAPVALPTVWSRWWWAWPIGAIILLAIIVWVVMRLRKRRRERVIIVLPHIWARQQIAALLAQQLIEEGQVQTFYYQINTIIRGYVERRFGVSAPEMTTEEFLTASARDSRFTTAVREQMIGFLTVCDMVKYARHEASAGECDEVIASAGRFIEHTRERVGVSDNDPKQAGQAA